MTFTNQRNFFFNRIAKKHFFKSKKSFFGCSYVFVIVYRKYFSPALEIRISDLNRFKVKITNIFNENNALKLNFR